ncbi:MAG: helix-turn-helix domain-containing protein [Candidatus Gastranaerophilaceae bacterium]
MDSIKKKIGNNVRRLRRIKGLKQTELAELVGVEDKTISRIEVGGNYPSVDLLVRMSEALDCELAEFVNFSDKVTECLSELTKEDIKVLKNLIYILGKKL